MRYAIILTISLTTSLLLFLAVLFRYELKETHPGGQSSGAGMVYRLDRWTGEIVGINGFDADHLNLNKWEEVTPKPSR